MGSPHSHRPFGLQVPVDDPTVRIASDQATVAVDDLDAVNLGSMAAEDVAGLRWRQTCSLLLSGHCSTEYCRRALRLADRESRNDVGKIDSMERAGGGSDTMRPSIGHSARTA